MLGKDFFQDHQKGLLRMANSQMGRDVLCIDKDAPEIRRIEPNAYFWQGKKKNQVGFNVRTHNKYSKRLFHAFKPLWWTAHQFDMYVANPLRPEWNLGFDAFGPLFPAAGANSPVDGIIRNQTTTIWDTIHDAASGTSALVSDASNACGFVQANGTNWINLIRSMFLFDTSSIDDGATIDDAILSLFGEATTADGLSISPTMNIFTATPAANNNLVSGDYDQFGTTDLSSDITIGSWSTVAYNDFSLNSTGLANIDVTGISKFGGRESTYDAPDVEPTIGNGFSGFFCFFADETGTTKDPKLAGNFSLAAAGNPVAFFM